MLRTITDFIPPYLYFQKSIQRTKATSFFRLCVKELPVEGAGSVWVIKLKDGREVTVRFLTAEDKERLGELFVSMSDEALKWGMPPYTKDVIERWINNIPNLIPLVVETSNRLVGYATIYKYRIRDEKA
jgi:hypothetical protein